MFDSEDGMTHTYSYLRCLDTSRRAKPTWSTTPVVIFVQLLLLPDGFLLDPNLNKGLKVMLYHFLRPWCAFEKDTWLNLGISSDLLCTKGPYPTLIIQSVLESLSV